MNPPRKPYASAVLKNLPEDRQEQIAEWIAKPNDRDDETGKVIPRTGGLAFAQDQLASDGLKVSLQALSEFALWWDLQQRFKRTASVTEQAEELMRSHNPGISEEEVRAFGQKVFTAQAIAENDKKGFVALSRIQLKAQHDSKTIEIKEQQLKQAQQKIAQKDKELDLSRRRVELLEQNAAKAKKELTKVAEKGGLSEKARAEIERIAKIL